MVPGEGVESGGWGHIRLPPEARGDVLCLGIPVRTGKRTESSMSRPGVASGYSLVLGIEGELERKALFEVGASVAASRPAARRQDGPISSHTHRGGGE
ncbi:hypothetical protein ElyMa_003997800 [Elysia marginata]|uniref:Uncharacterized protein n=1 Tax=Elysia marginata TaxID=1093978 RepID=A0AAV4G0E4_9GAST|nr:hypothetical protein ElyMa_003997800 [Elysia marginata]